MYVLHLSGPEEMKYNDFVMEGWRRENGEDPIIFNKLSVKEVKLWPVNSGDQLEKMDNTLETLNPQVRLLAH